MKKILLIILVLVIANCKKNEKNYKFTSKINTSEIDTNDDKKVDTKGFYFEEPNFIRLVFNEMDSNLDGFSDLFIWVGSHTAPKKDSQMRDVVKVHEEIDDDFDGKIDQIKWLLPNEFIALVQKDRDKDGYFETTEYFNFKKTSVRTEIDTDFNGRADIFYWSVRAEIDDDSDGIPEYVTLAPTLLILEDRITKFKSSTVEEKVKMLEFKKLNPQDSWLLNPSLIPPDQKAIIGSGM